MATDPSINMGKGVLVLTYSCNLKCSFCYAGVEVFDRPRSMSIAEARRGIEFMRSIGIQTFTLLGGEPTVYGRLAEVVRYAAEQDMGAWIVTNGSRLADAGYGQELVDAGLKGGCISIHGHSAAQHDGGTQVPGSFDSAVAAVRNAVDQDWPIYPMLTVMDSNLADVMPAIELFRGLGCKTIYINYGVPNIVPDLDTGVASGPEALARLTEELFNLMPSLGVRFVFNREKNKIPLCHFDHDLLAEMFASEIIGTGCEAAEGSTVVIEPGGSVLGCSHWVDHPLLSIYRDYECLELLTPDEFWAQWSTGNPAAYREDMRFFPYDACTGCGWRTSKMCFGGCKVWQSAGAIPTHIEFDGHDQPVRVRGRKMIPVVSS